ncbi:hypothetical protein [Comamonas denitrificans]|nr:hypothetical protein [Comamonas denitrificans]
MHQLRGWRIGLLLTPQATPPGWAVGLRFAEQSIPDADQLTPGGTLPLAALGFAGTLTAAFTERSSTDLTPSGTLPLAALGFAGTLAAPYSSGVHRPLVHGSVVAWQQAQTLLTTALVSPFGHAFALHPGGTLPLGLPGFAGALSGRYAERAFLSPGGTLPLALGFSGGIVTEYDSRVQRPLARFARAEVFQQAQALGSGPLAAVMQDAARASAQVRDVVQQAQALAAQVQGTAQQVRSLPAQVRDVAQQAQPLRQRSASAFEVAQALHHALHSQAQQAQRLPVAALVYTWQIADPRRAQHLERFEQGGIQRHMGLRVPPVYVLGPGWRIALEFAPQFDVPRTWGELQTGPLLSGAGLAHHLAQPTTGVRYHDTMRPGPALVKETWPPEGGGGGTDPEEPGQTIIITARRAYIVQNSITLTRLDTGAELQAHSFGMSLDYQSWTWSWQASLHHTAAAHLGRDTQGDPADLLATINGVQFRLRLERVARDRRHLPQERYSVSGKGRAAILDAPWAPVMQFGNPLAEYTAQQLAVNTLTINGVGIGWGVEWQLDDWLVPAGAWALQGSYIAAINDIAQAVGGYVQPHNTDPVLRILHKYPTAPWEWGAVTPDFEIPSALAEVESTEFIDKPLYNRIYVGGQGAGVFGPLTRAATPGDKIAPQATHPLITASAAWRQRGRAELSDVGKQERIRISLPVLAETGVITPGQFVRYRTSPSSTQTGIVRGTAIDWQRPRLRQTLEIEAHEPV